MMSGCTFLDFHRTSKSEVWLPTKDNDVMRQIQAFFSTKGSLPAPVQILTHQPQRLPFSWRVTWKVTFLTCKRRATSLYLNPTEASQWLGKKSRAISLGSVFADSSGRDLLPPSLCVGFRILSHLCAKFGEQRPTFYKASSSSSFAFIRLTHLSKRMFHARYG